MGMPTTDMFDKFVHARPIAERKEEDVASGMVGCLNKSGNRPTLFTEKRLHKLLKNENRT